MQVLYGNQRLYSQVKTKAVYSYVFTYFVAFF